jgi:hypothetical protein
MCLDRSRLIVLILVVILVPTDWATAQPGPSTAVVSEALEGVSTGTPSGPTGDGPWIVRAYEWTQETVEELGTHFEHLGVYPEKGMLLLHLDNRQELEMLLEKGLRVEVDEGQTRKP